MDSEPDQHTDAPSCNKCAGKLMLVGSLPRSGVKPRTSIFKCIPCGLALAVPPID